MSAYDRWLEEPIQEAYAEADRYQEEIEKKAEEIEEALDAIANGDKRVLELLLVMLGMIEGDEHIEELHRILP